MKSPTVLLQSLLTDVSRLEPDVKGLDRDIITIEQRFKDEGYGFLAIALPKLCDALDQGLATRRFTCPTGFKTTREGTIPRLFSGMFCEIFDPSSGSLKSTPNLGIVKCLREVLRSFKKIQLDLDSSEELDRKAKSEFFSNDTIVRDSYIEDRIEYSLRRVSKVILPGLCSIDFSELIFKHGPGAVSEGDKGNQKWSSLLKGILTDAFDVDGLGYRLFGLSANNESYLQPIESKIAPPLFPENGSSSRIARLVSVPKNSTSARTITVEPMLNQFIQQGLNTVLRKYIIRCPILKQCLALSDQSKNQHLALVGSLTDEWATLDLKSASDLLSVKLVEAVFGHHGLFLDQILDCRSQRVKDGKSVVDIFKFAGMGNALTFPVQSVAFAVVAIAAICDVQEKSPTYWDIKRAARCIRVYGDDIIVRTEYASQVVSWLEKVGLKINHSKSFLKGNFKESCGVDAFMGVDVTPIYVRYRPDSSSTDADAIAALVSLSNQAWLRGLYEFSACLQDEVENRLRKRLPLVPIDSGALGWHTRLNASTPNRWNRSLHRFETQSYVVGPVKSKDRLDGYAALLKFFHVPLLGRARNHLTESPVRFATRLVRKWVPSL